MLQAMGAASPVVLTMVSAPVFAGGGPNGVPGLCLMPSGFISQNTFLSRHPGAVACTDRGPNFFITNYPGIFPSTPAPDTLTEPFRSSLLFGSAGSGPDAALLTPTITLQGVLGNGGVSEFTKYCIAAYLNARIGTSNFPINAAQAIAVWRHFRAGGSASFIPAAWTEATALAWLKILMSP